MNSLIYYVWESGASYSMYNIINTVGLIVALLYSIWHGKKIGIPLWKMLIILVAMYLGMGAVQGGIWEILLAMKENHILGIETPVNSIVRTFIFLPVIAIPIAWILRLKWSHVCDAIVMYPLVKSGIAQIACIFPGCCRGYECEWGIYNIKSNAYHFPTPILETILTLFIFLYLLYIISEKKHVSDGSLYPTMIFLYGIMRFICEMLRDNEKLVLGVSAVGIHALILFALGGVILVVKRKKQIKPTPQKQEDTIIEQVSDIELIEEKNVDDNGLVAEDIPQNN